MPKRFPSCPRPRRLILPGAIALGESIKSARGRLLQEKRSDAHEGSNNAWLRHGRSSAQSANAAIRIRGSERLGEHRNRFWWGRTAYSTLHGGWGGLRWHSMSGETLSAHSYAWIGVAGRRPLAALDPGIGLVRPVVLVARPPLSTPRAYDPAFDSIGLIGLSRRFWLG